MQRVAGEQNKGNKKNYTGKKLFDVYFISPKAEIPEKYEYFCTKTQFNSQRHVFLLINETMNLSPANVMFFLQIIKKFRLISPIFQHLDSLASLFSKKRSPLRKAEGCLVYFS
ncbi:MAG: hypothetical protein CSB06_01585 [Bacteroidia bacterium]|nr:MAG: hypothetical protein CSB06_01585 [Bacteroidia bacterium]